MGMLPQAVLDRLPWRRQGTQAKKASVVRTPVVLQIEALAQAAAILAIESFNLTNSGKLVYFLGIEQAKFRAPVEPGVLLDLRVGFVQKSSRVCKFWGRASIGETLTCECQFAAMIADPPKS